MTLSSQQKKHFRTIGHKLKPVSTLGSKGLSDAFLAELERAMEDHELIKIKIAAQDRSEKAALTEKIKQHTEAEVVQAIGHTLLLYRPAKKPDPRKSNLLRQL